MLAAGPKTLTEVFDLTFTHPLAARSSAHTHTQACTFLILNFSLCLNKPPQHGNAFFTEMPLMSKTVVHSCRLWLHPQALQAYL